MPLDKIRYTFKITKPSGLVFWYFRHKTLTTKQLPLPGKPGDPSFQREYSRLLDQVSNVTKAAVQIADSRSIRWLSEGYRASDEWAQLSEKTRHDYGRELDRLCTMVGDLPFSKLTSEGVRTMRKQVKADIVVSRTRAVGEHTKRLRANEEAGKPASRRGAPAAVTATTGARTADYFKSVLSALMSWGVEHEHLTSNPANNIKKLHRKNNVESRKPWTEHQVQFAIEHGPRHIRDGVILGAYTGQRLKTCCNMLKTHSVGKQVRIKQEKTGNLVDVYATGPLVNLIARRLGANSPDDAPQLLIQDNGKRYTERLYSAHLREWLNEQGWTDVSFHGLRYAAAGTLNEAGATVATIVSVIGHSTYQMALKYLAAREDAKRAADFMQEAADRRGDHG